MNNNNKTVRSVFSLGSIYLIIQAVFICLRAAEVTAIGAWSWAKVFVPTYIYFGGIVAILLIIFIIWIICVFAGWRK